MDILNPVSDRKLRDALENTRFKTVTMVEGDDLPAIPWVVPGALMRGSVTMLIGPPGSHKTQLLVGLTVAMAKPLTVQEEHSGKRRFGNTLWPVKRMRVLSYLAEEDEDMQNRMFAVARQQQNVMLDDIRDQVRMVIADGPGRLITWEQSNNSVRTTALMEDLERHIQEFNPDVVMLDPIAEMYDGIDENKNAQMNQLGSHLRRLAQEHNLAILVAVHTRKGTATPGDLEIARGASALGGSVRFAFSLLPMSAEDADRLNVPRGEHRYYVRMDEAKASYSAPAEGAVWFRAHAHPVGQPDHWTGKISELSSLEGWTPERAVRPDEMTMLAIEAEIARGWTDTLGRVWPFSGKAGYDRSVQPLLERHGVRRVHWGLALEALAELGVHEARYRDAYRKAMTGYRTRAMLPVVAWMDSGPKPAALRRSRAAMSESSAAVPSAGRDSSHASDGGAPIPPIKEAPHHYPEVRTFSPYAGGGSLEAPPPSSAPGGPESETPQTSKLPDGQNRHVMAPGPAGGVSASRGGAGGSAAVVRHSFGAPEGSAAAPRSDPAAVAAAVGDAAEGSAATPALAEREALLLAIIAEGCLQAGGAPWSPTLDDSTRSVRHAIWAAGYTNEDVGFNALDGLGVCKGWFAVPDGHSIGLRTRQGPGAAWCAEPLIGRRMVP